MHSFAVPSSMTIACIYRVISKYTEERYRTSSQLDDTCYNSVLF